MPFDGNDRGGWQEGPPDLGQVIKKAKDSMGLGRGGKYLWVIVVVVILAIIVVSTALYRIPAGHRGVVLRFGKYSRTAMPGINAKIPFGIEAVYKVHTAKEDSEGFGFRTVRPGIRTQYEKSAMMERESLMLTGDLNVIDVEWIVQFQGGPKRIPFQRPRPHQGAPGHQRIGDSARRGKLEL